MYETTPYRPTALNVSAMAAEMSSSIIVKDVCAIDFATIISIGRGSSTGTCGSSSATMPRTTWNICDASMIGARTTRNM